MKKFAKILSVLLCLAMVVGLVAVVFATETATYTKYTDSTLTSGTYVLVANNGYAPKVFDNGWLTPAQPTISGDQVTDAAGAVWTLTVDGTNVKLTDSNGATIGPKTGNSNGVQAKDYNWAWSYENGAFLFKGQGSDTTTLACNTDATNGLNHFRAYKNTTVTNTTTYRSTFTLYKLDDGSGAPVVPPAEPELTLVDISTALAGNAGEKFMVKGVVTLIDGSNLYVQDATGAICVRASATPTDVALGDTIIGTGTRDTYNGLPQLGSATYEKSEGLTLSAKETTIDALTTDDVATYISIAGLEVTEVYDNDGKYTNPNITVKDANGNEIQIYKAVIDKDGDNWTVKVGDIIDVKAAVGIFKTTLQLRNTLSSEINVVPQAAPSSPVLEITVNFVDCKEGDEFTLVFGNIFGAEYEGQTLVFTADNNVQDLSIPKKDLSWMFGDGQGSYYTLTYPEGYTVTSEFLDGDGNDPSIKGHATFTVTGLGNDTTDDPTDDPTDEPTDDPTDEPELIQKPVLQTKPEAGKGYLFGLYQANKGQTLFFTGEMDGYYLAVSNDLNAAVEVFVEEVEGGYKLYFMKGSDKTYIDIVPRENAEGKVNVVLAAEGTAVYTYDSARNTFVANVIGENWYLGTYSDYTTISASKTSYIEDVTTIGVSQFPAGMYLIEDVAADTGDITVSILVGLMAVSAIGAAAVVCKKKEN